MPIADSDAERRNLSVLSGAIILFYLSDAKLASDTLSLPMVNLTIKDVDTLVIFLWATLFWFCFRYWQESHEAGLLAISQCLNKHPYRNHKSIHRNIQSSFEGKQLVSVKALTFNQHGFSVIYTKLKSDGSTIKHDQKHTKTLSGVPGTWAVFRATLAMSRTEGCVWSYKFPYILFGFALYLGLKNAYFSWA